MNKLLLFLVVVAVPLAALTFLLHEQSRPSPRYTPGGVVPEEISAPGWIEGATSQADLRFPVSARCVELLVREGDYVEAGQLLVRVDDAARQADLALAQSDVELAKAQLERLVNGARPEERRELDALYRAKLAELHQARQAWERIEELHRARAISQQEADDQRAIVDTLAAQMEAAKARAAAAHAKAREDEVRAATSRVEAALARLAGAEAALRDTRLRAPLAGRILQVNVEPGEIVGPSDLEPAVVLADTSSFRIRAFVEEFDAPRVRVGQRAMARVEGLPEVPLVGFVARVSPRIGRKRLWTRDPSERNDAKVREVWIHLKEPPDLVIGLRVDVRIAEPTEDRASSEGTEGGTDTEL